MWVRLVVKLWGAGLGELVVRVCLFRRVTLSVQPGGKRMWRWVGQAGRGQRDRWVGSGSGKRERWECI